MLREGFPTLAILLVVNSESHQVYWRMLVSKLGRWNLLPICKELDVAQTKLLCALLSFSVVTCRRKKNAISISSPTALSCRSEVSHVVMYMWLGTWTGMVSCLMVTGSDLQ